MMKNAKRKIPKAKENSKPEKNPKDAWLLKYHD